MRCRKRSQYQRRFGASPLSSPTSSQASTPLYNDNRPLAQCQSPCITTFHPNLSNMIAFSLSPSLRDFITFAATSSVLLYTLFSLFRVGRRSHGLPPGNSNQKLTLSNIGLTLRKGPPTVPLLGNEHQIPKSDGHFVYASNVFSGSPCEANGIDQHDQMVQGIWRYLFPETVSEYHACDQRLEVHQESARQEKYTLQQPATISRCGFDYSWRSHLDDAVRADLAHNA